MPEQRRAGQLVYHKIAISTVIQWLLIPFFFSFFFLAWPNKGGPQRSVSLSINSSLHLEFALCSVTGFLIPSGPCNSYSCNKDWELDTPWY